MCVLCDFLCANRLLFRNSHSTADGETIRFLTNQPIIWKGFLNMLCVAKFMTKGYVVSGSAENLKAVFTIFHPCFASLAYINVRFHVC